MRRARGAGSPPARLTEQRWNNTDGSSYDEDYHAITAEGLGYGAVTARVPLAAEGWWSLRAVLQRERNRPSNLEARGVAGRAPGGGTRDVVPTATSLLRRYCPAWDLCGRRTLSEPYEMIDWPDEGWCRAVVGPGWSSVSHPAGGEYFDVYVRRRWVPWSKTTQR